MALCEEGDEVAVTLDNLRSYVHAYVDCILSTSVEKQVRLLAIAYSMCSRCVMAHLTNLQGGVIPSVPFSWETAREG